MFNKRPMDVHLGYPAQTWRTEFGHPMDVRVLVGFSLEVESSTEESIAVRR